MVVMWGMGRQQVGVGTGAKIGAKGKRVLVVKNRKTQRQQ